MKELSIEEKAKAYDEAIERAKEWSKAESGYYTPKERCEKIFPELKESEDEKKKRILLSISSKMSFHLCDIFTEEEFQCFDAWSYDWLEKQGEQKLAFEMKTPEESLGIDSDTYNKIVDECVYSEQKPTDKVEPKFHEGDWAVSNLDGKARQISEVHFDEYNSYYVVNGQSVNLEEYDRLHHLWTIQDAKDGDVLSNWNNTTFIFKAIEDETVKFHIAYNEKWDEIKTPLTKLYHLGLSEPQFEFHPATREKRDLLFQKMKEAGYEWEAEKKELKKIEQKSAEFDDTNAKQMFIKALERVEEQNNKGYKLTDCDKNSWWEDFKTYTSCIVEQEPAWSEEDERMYRKLHNLIYSTPYCDSRKELSDWLKSLKGKILIKSNG